MKNRLYTLFTTLLMVACMTGHGQELVREFSHSNGLMNSGCEIVEAADGTLLIGSNVHPNDSTTSFVVFKYTFEGELMDSLVFPGRSHLWTVNPLDPEGQVSASFVAENASASVKIAFVGPDFCVTDDLLVPIPNFDGNCSVSSVLFLDTHNDIIGYYWNSNQLHFIRIGLDGTLKQDKEAEGIYPPAGRPDTTAYYMEAKLFNDAPQQFSLLGAIGMNNYNWPLIGYTFDDDFNRIDKHIYSLIKEGILANGGMGEHITPFDEASYLLAARIQHDNNGYAGLIKFSRANHEPMQIQLFEGNDPYRLNVAPCDTKVLDNHSIYFTYLTHVSTNNSVALVRTSPDLDRIWRVTLPEIPQQVFGGSRITVLSDGNIVLGTTVYREDYSKTDLRIYIIHDSYDTLKENNKTERPFILYPNPVKDLLTLRFDDGAEPESVELYNFAGGLVATKCNTMETIDMNAITSGVYTLCVTLKDGTRYHEKIIKE